MQCLPGQRRWPELGRGPAGQRLRLSRIHLTTFSPLGLVPLVASKTADSGTTDAGGTNGYTISISNPNADGASLASITDTLPSGFAYLPGTTTGATTVDPVIVGNVLTWTGPSRWARTAPSPSSSTSQSPPRRARTTTRRRLMAASTPSWPPVRPRSSKSRTSSTRRPRRSTTSTPCPRRARSSSTSIQQRHGSGVRLAVDQRGPEPVRPGWFGGLQRRRIVLVRPRARLHRHGHVQLHDRRR